MPVLQNPKREKFARLLFNRKAGHTILDCYLEAGYVAPPSRKSCRTKADRLAREPDIKKRLGELKTRAARRAVVSKANILTQYHAIAHSDIRKIVKWGESIAVKDEDDKPQIVTGMAFIGSDQIDDATAAAISEVSIDKNGQLKIKFHDKRAALHDLGQHLGMFVKRIGGPDGGPLQVDAVIRPDMTPRDAADAYARTLNSTVIEHEPEEPESDDEEEVDSNIDAGGPADADEG